MNTMMRRLGAARTLTNSTLNRTFLYSCIGFAALLATACQSGAPAASTSASASASTMPTKPDLSGFAVVEHGQHARYLIDTRSQTCLLMIDNAVTTKVSCRALRRNHPAAAKHISWRQPATRTRRRVRRRHGAFGGNAELRNLIAKGVKKVGAHSYEIRSTLLRRLLVSPNKASRGARIVPSVRDGAPNGFKVYAIRPASIYAQVGIRNGDTIHTINGNDVSSADKALEVYGKLHTATKVVLNITRRSKPVVLTFHIK